jgi:Family of unknown function (DUF7033)
LKIAVLSSEPVTDAQRRAIAAVLLRTGLSIQVVEPKEALVLLVWGKAPKGLPRRPRVEIPRQELSMDLFPDFLDTVIGRATGTEHSLIERQTKTITSLNLDLITLAQGLLEGWEEDAGPHDHHGRFSPEGSAAYRHEVLDRPLLDEWCRALGKMLWKASGASDSEFPTPEWSFCLTLDIDSAGMFRPARSAVRHFRQIIKEVPNRLPAAMILALQTWIGAARDPHLRVRELAEMLEGMEVPSTFFVQTHRKSPLDSYDLSQHGYLLRSLWAICNSGYHQVGLHSSYATVESDPGFFSAQWKRLGKLLNQAPHPVHRAHYLRCPEQAGYELPRGMKNLVDSSLGFGSAEGFRRSTAWPFRSAQGVIELPPTVMDTTLRYFQGLDAEQAYERSVALMEKVQQTGGAFVPIFHPNNQDPFLWPGWREVLQDLSREAKRRGGSLQSLAHCARMLQTRSDQMEDGLRKSGL